MCASYITSPICVLFTSSWKRLVGINILLWSFLRISIHMIMWKDLCSGNDSPPWFTSRYLACYDKCNKEQKHQSKTELIKSDEQCVAIPRVMRDPGVDGKTSWKASFTEPANPNGEFLRWWAEATNQFAHAEPWQQPHLCDVWVCVDGGGVVFTSVCVCEKCVFARSRSRVSVSSSIRSVSSVFRSCV